MPPPVAAAGIMAGSQLLGSALQGGQRQTNTAVPPELMGPRQDQINLIQQLLGGGRSTGAMGGLGPPGQGLAGISNYFGDIGMPMSDLQRQSIGGMQQLLGGSSPAMSAINTAFPSLQGMMTGTGPQFERDLSLANQQGSRFGSANEILRGEAMRNLFNMRNQTAQTIGMLGQTQGGLMNQGFGMGQQEAQQGNIGLERLLSLFGGIFGARQQMTAGLPITQQPTGMQSLGQNISGLGMLLPFLMGGGGGGGGAPGTAAFGQGFDLMKLLGGQTPMVDPGSTGIRPATPQQAF